MKKEEINKIKRQWGQWKRHKLSIKEKKELCFSMFVDFLCAKGLFDKVIKRSPEKID